MQPADWARLGPLVDKALDATPAEREAVIAALSGGDPQRQAELEQLVAECDIDTPFLDRPAGERFASLFEEEPDATLPEVLGGQYRIEREIGRGGMARVYLARDEKHARSVAIKVIRPDIAASLGRERFLREIGIAARLRHPNIVPLFDSGDADGLLHFVMPFEEGPSLRARLAAGPPLSGGERMSILRDIARALTYAHEQGVVHRDVKPDNVMLSSGAAVVTDFGIAKAVSVAQGATAGNTLTHSGAGLGTPAYMSPEQAVGDPATDHRADLYSFGCLAYELFAGHPPFHGLPTHQIITAQVATPPVPLQAVNPEVPDAIARLIGQCLEKSPDARPQHARELLILLEAEPTSRRIGWTPRRVVIAGVGVVSAVLIVAGIRSNQTPTAPAAERKLMVLPMENETGDGSLDYVATGVAEGVALRLDGSGGLAVRSGARLEWPASAQHNYASSAGVFGPTILLRMVLTRAGDSLEVRSSVLDADTKEEKALAPRRFTTAQMREVESGIAAAVRGAIFRVARPAEPREPDRPIDPESYRLMLEGWHQFFTIRDVPRAKELFLQATVRDPDNARAWSGLSSAWGNQTITNRVPFEVGFERTTATASRAIALDSLQGSALANLAIVSAWKYRNLAVGEKLLRQAKAAEPSNAEIYQVEGALYRHAWQFVKAEDATRVAQQLDPLRSTLVGLEADLLACQNKISEAERLLQREIAVNPTGIARRRLPYILARLGRHDEAIAAMREDAILAGQDSIAAGMASARGQDGYWSVVHQRGRRRLAGLLEQRKRAWASPFQIMIAEFEAGETAAAYASLAQLEKENDLNLVKLRCSSEIDGERGKPRLEGALARIQGFALR